MSKVVKHNMKFRVVMMTPTWAAEILEHNHPNNRTPKLKKITAMAREMRSGLWELTHQSVATDEDGLLIDGQNRLLACMEAGVEVPMVLVTGVPSRGMQAADCGTTRTIADAARISGKAFDRVIYGSIGRSMVMGYAQSPIAMGYGELLAFIEKHKKAIAFPFDYIKSNNHAPTQVRAVISRAWYTQDRDRLGEFAGALSSGLVEAIKTDVAVIRLRNWLLAPRAEKRHVGKKEIYGKAQRALRAFLDGEPIGMLYAESRTELFKLPGE